jgi:5-oxoprolinase (ATP-hydrolysing)
MRLTEVWADVGGTFTDCFVVTPEQVRRSTKVLSSGRVRAGVVEISGNRVVVDGSLDDVDDFWRGGKAELLFHDPDGSHPAGEATDGAYKIVGFDAASQTLTLDRGVMAPLALRSGCVIELDAGLEAPVLAARRLMGVPLWMPLPPIDMRLGTTRGTNALLTRTGAAVALLTTRGFGDLLEIGEQNRPELFELAIHKPEPLTRHVVELDERLAADGTVLRRLDPDEARAALVAIRDAGIRSIAVCLLHSHVNDVHERQIGQIADSLGFDNVSLSSVVAPLIKLVPRAETTVLDAYLNPILANYLSRIRSQLGDAEGGRVRLMTSGGNLVDADSFRGRDSILSGPAGGVVSLGKIATTYQAPAAIGLDMGGTSTDVSRFEGRVARQYESRKAGIRVLTPMMAIHTVAAGGGSICDCVDGRLVVGPQSAGADPGPACYGRGGPLTVTDLNVVLGRLPGDRFPFPLDVAAARRRLHEVNAKLGDQAFASIELAAEGFLKIAVTHMAEAVRTVSTAEGSDPRRMTLVGFGGAAGGHLCGIADSIGMSRVIDHRDASLLSALGMGLADIGRVHSVGVYRPADQLDDAFWDATFAHLRQKVMDGLVTEVSEDACLDQIADVRFEVDARYIGTESTLPLEASPVGSIGQRYHQAHRSTFGYEQPHRGVEVAAVRCEATIRSAAALDPPQPAESSSALSRPGEMSIGGKSVAVPIHDRSSVASGETLRGPCIVIDASSTLVIDDGWSATKLPGNSFELTRTDEGTEAHAEADAVMVEVVARRLQGIADAMGELLRRTAVSVNVKERLDFSCAVFDSEGTLLANAPHVPVHLGAMGHTVRHLMQTYPRMSDGDVYLSNDPYAGGSHLPDVTVVTPVFCATDGSRSEQTGRADFFVASRAHHSEIGGKTPGSMPPDARSLAEEGVVITSFALCRDGHEYLDELRHLLGSGRYPSRNPDVNIADITAQRAAGIAGAARVAELVATYGITLVDACTGRMLDQAAESVGRWIETLGDQTREFEDTLDDGTRIRVALVPGGGRLRIDFTGTSPVHPGCFNATPAIVTAATLYVVRTLIGGNLPMNGGITSRIDFVIPSGLLNPPRGETPDQCAAVVAGNVETSMRIVDVLLGALGVAAASQGTMNNVLIGDSSFGYYETIGGGSGATPAACGASGVHCHMTNTRITDPEIYESRYPVRLLRFAIRRDSGGNGKHRGGDGLIREIEFLRPLTVSLITNRRGDQKPWGIDGGQPGSAGRNTLTTADGDRHDLPPATTFAVQAGDSLRIETPGGGGYGKA